MSLLCAKCGANTPTWFAVRAFSLRVWWSVFAHLSCVVNGVCNKSHHSGYMLGCESTERELKPQMEALRSDLNYNREIRRYWKARALVAESKL